MFMNINDKKTMNESLGSRLKKARKSAGYSQVVAAEKIGISQSALSDLENGESYKTKHVAEISAVYKVNPIWLGTGKGSMQDEKAPQGYSELSETDKKIVADLINSLHAAAQAKKQ